MKITLNNRILRMGLPGILLMLASKSALASCSFMDSRFGPSDGGSFIFGNVVVQRDTPVGTVVATQTGTALAGRNNFIECNTSGFASQWAAGGGFTPVSYGGQTLYESGIPGLAFRIVTPGAGSTSGRYGSGALPRTLTGVSCNNGPNWWRLCGGTWGNLSVQLVKISATTGSGQLATGTLVKAVVRGETDVYTYNVGSGRVQTVACSVTSNSIWVAMGDVKNTVFSGVGSTSPSTDFSIALNCDASTNVNLTITPGSAGAFDAAKGILTMDNPDSTTVATGVGVQVLYNSAPVSLGTRFRVATTSADGAYSIPLQARYYQTKTAITPGQANANATFTMTYQ